MYSETVLLAVVYKTVAMFFCFLYVHMYRELDIFAYQLHSLGKM